MNRKTERILSSLIILHSEFERKCLEKLGVLSQGAYKYKEFLFEQIDLGNEDFIDIKKLMSFLSSQDISVDIEDVIQLFKMLLPSTIDRHLTRDNFLDFLDGRHSNPAIMSKGLRRSKISEMLQKARQRSIQEEEVAQNPRYLTSDVRKSIEFEKRNKDALVQEKKRVDRKQNIDAKKTSLEVQSQGVKLISGHTSELQLIEQQHRAHPKPNIHSKDYEVIDRQHEELGETQGLILAEPEKISQGGFSAKSTYSQFQDLKRCISDKYEHLSRHFDQKETYLRPSTHFESQQHTRQSSYSREADLFGIHSSNVHEDQLMSKLANKPNFSGMSIPTVQVTPRDVIFSKIDIERTQKTNDFADSEFKLEQVKHASEPLNFEEHCYIRNPSCRLEYEYLSFNQGQDKTEVQQRRSKNIENDRELDLLRRNTPRVDLIDNFCPENMHTDRSSVQFDISNFDSNHPYYAAVQSDKKDYSYTNYYEKTQEILELAMRKSHNREDCENVASKILGLDDPTKVLRSQNQSILFELAEKENYKDGVRPSRVPQLSFEAIQNRNPFNPRIDLLPDQPDDEHHDHLRFSQEIRDSFVVKVDADTLDFQGFYEQGISKFSTEQKPTPDHSGHKIAQTDNENLYSPSSSNQNQNSSRLDESLKRDLMDTDTLHNLHHSNQNRGAEFGDTETLIFENSHYDPKCDTSKLIVQADLVMVDFPRKPFRGSSDNSRNHHQLLSQNDPKSQVLRTQLKSQDSGDSKLELYRKYLQNDVTNSGIFSENSDEVEKQHTSGFEERESFNHKKKMGLESEIRKYQLQRHKQIDHDLRWAKDEFTAHQVQPQSVLDLDTNHQQIRFHNQKLDIDVEGYYYDSNQGEKIEAQEQEQSLGRKQSQSTFQSGNTQSLFNRAPFGVSQTSIGNSQFLISNPQNYSMISRSQNQTSSILQINPKHLNKSLNSSKIDDVSLMSDKENLKGYENQGKVQTRMHNVFRQSEMVPILKRIPEESSRSNRIPFSEKDALPVFSNQENLSMDYPCSSEMRQSKSSPHFENPKVEGEYQGINSRNKMMMSTPRDFHEEYNFELSEIYGQNDSTFKKGHQVEKLENFNQEESLRHKNYSNRDAPQTVQPDQELLEGGKIYQLIEGLLYIENKLETIRCKLAQNKDFNVAVLYEFLDKDFSGYIKKEDLGDLFIMLEIEFTEADFDGFCGSNFGREIQKIPFSKFSSLFYPSSKAYFQKMREKMYSENSRTRYDKFKEETLQLLKLFFMCLLEMNLMISHCKSICGKSEFMGFLKSMGVQTGRLYFNLVDFTKKEVFPEFGDDVKIKIFEKIDKNKNCRIFVEDLASFLSS